MPYRNKQMLRDANSDLIPQYWDVAAGEFKPLTGSDGANHTQVTGSIREQELDGGITITPGVRQVIFSVDNVVDYTHMSIFSRSTEGHKFSIEVDFHAKTRGQFSSFRKKELADFDSHVGEITLVPIYLPQIRVYITNRDLEDRYYEPVMIFTKG